MIEFHLRNVVISLKFGQIHFSLEEETAAGFKQKREKNKTGFEAEEFPLLGN